MLMSTKLSGRISSSIGLSKLNRHKPTETYLVFPAAMVFAHRSQALQFVFPGDLDWDTPQRTANSADRVIKKQFTFHFKALKAIWCTKTYAHKRSLL